MIALAAATVLLQTPTYDLRVRGRVGDKYGIAITMGLSTVGVEGSMTSKMEVREHLVKSEPKRLFWEQKFSVVSVQASGVLKEAEKSMFELDKITMVSIQDPQGRVLESVMGNLRTKGTPTSNVVLPEKPVAVGESWPAEIQTPVKLYRINYRLDAVKDGDATIIGTFPDGQGVEVVRPTTFLVDVKTGKMKRASSEHIFTLPEAKIRLSYDIESIRP